MHTIANQTEYLPLPIICQKITTKCNARVVIDFFFCFLNSSKEDAFTIFRDAAALNMTEAGHVWIVTEQALSANNTPDGVLGLQLVYANSEKEHIRVSVCL